MPTHAEIQAQVPAWIDEIIEDENKNDRLHIIIRDFLINVKEDNPKYKPSTKQLKALYQRALDKSPTLKRKYQHDIRGFLKDMVEDTHEGIKEAGMVLGGDFVGDDDDADDDSVFKQHELQRRLMEWIKARQVDVGKKGIPVLTYPTVTFTTLGKKVSQLAKDAELLPRQEFMVDIVKNVIPKNKYPFPRQPGQDEDDYYLQLTCGLLRKISKSAGVSIRTSVPPDPRTGKSKIPKELQCKYWLRAKRKTKSKSKAKKKTKVSKKTKPKIIQAAPGFAPYAAAPVTVLKAKPKSKAPKKTKPKKISPTIIQAAPGFAPYAAAPVTVPKARPKTKAPKKTKPKKIPVTVLKTKAKTKTRPKSAKPKTKAKSKAKTKASRPKSKAKSRRSRSPTPKKGTTIWSKPPMNYRGDVKYSRTAKGSIIRKGPGAKVWSYTSKKEADYAER